MLRTQGWEKVFSKAHSYGASSAELYVDSCLHTQLNFEAKYSHRRSFETGGSQLILQSPRGNQAFLSTSRDPDNLAAILCSEPFLIGRDSDKLCETPFSVSPNNHKLLEQACRKTLLAQPGILEFKACYQEQIKHFLFANESQDVFQGFETSGCLTADFTVGNGIKQKKFRVRKGRTDIPSLIAELQDCWLPRFSLDKALEHPWPVPNGKVPVLWSSSCVAQFALSLLRIIEFQSRKSDLLENLENRLGGMSFQIIDNWKQVNNRDVEGRKRQATLLIDGGKLVTPLNSSTEGFSRRENHQSYPITVPWEPALFGIERTHHLLKEMDCGISVHEIEILSLEPQTGLVSFEISEASLIHQGVEGEHIESIQLNLSLFDLLRSLKLFSEANSPEPLIWSQLGQQLFVEVTAPQALSPSWDLSGTVPLNHYW